MTGGWRLVKGFICPGVLEEFVGSFEGEDHNSGI